MILGSIVALVQFFLGDLIYPGGFGLSRWISALVDIVVLPALLPFFVYFLFVLFRLFRFTAPSTDFGNFALLWLIPCSALKAVSWGAGSDLTLLVLVPLLWTALACGISFFIDLIRAFLHWYIIIPSALGILILPFLAATAWWAFYSQKPDQGFFLLASTLLPLVVSLIIAWVRQVKRGK